MLNSIATIFTALCGFYILAQILWYLFKRLNDHDVTYLPGDVPLFGHALMLKDREHFNKNKEMWYNKYGEMFGLYLTFNRVVFTRSPTICEDLLSSQKYLSKGVGYSLIEKFIGNGLLTSDGELWRKRRKMITPAFHFDILNDFASIMENKTFDLLKYLEKYKGESFDVFKVTKPFSMSIICETAMGLEMSLDETSSGRFNQLYEGNALLLYRRHIRPWLKYDCVYYWTSDWKYFNTFRDHLREFVREIVENRKRVRQHKDDMDESKRRIFIDILLEAYEKEEIDVDGILDEVNTFVNAGYETTSTALAWCLYCLGRNQRVQDKLYEELNAHGKSDSSLKVGILKEFKYLDVVIKETLRLHPVVSRLSRAVPSGSVLGGKTFPECSVGIDITAMNRNPDVWENPLDFNPERFEKFEAGKKNPFVYIPFSAGPRNCIGQRFAMLELKIALYHLIRTFCVTSLQKESELKETFDITHGCEGGLFISLEKRNY